MNDAADSVFVSLVNYGTTAATNITIPLYEQNSVDAIGVALIKLGKWYYIIEATILTRVSGDVVFDSIPAKSCATAGLTGLVITEDALTVVIPAWISGSESPSQV